MGHCGDRFERYMARKSDKKWVQGSFPFHYYGDPGEGTTSASRELSANIGCADGTREAFADTSKYPNIAGCAAKWSIALGMCPPGNVGSANDKYGCSACAAGWHLCGWRPVAGLAQPKCSLGPAMAGADSAEVSRHVCEKDCKAQPGIFATAATFAATAADHPCNSCSSKQQAMGCGTLTTGAGGDTKNDCTGFPSVKGTSCKDNDKCFASGFRCCDNNASVGRPGQWRGVLCCRDGVESTTKMCEA
eukprot:comp18947_c0_seq2/m.34811 comp18947_c0_seq2/g.34811  ORF comp18947_c0_seq2/g.34811 comp18947_c0_seq2/m.34811 type:complete len:247 (-) comp18947_c0_seq2:79-819(-)